MENMKIDGTVLALSDIVHSQVPNGIPDDSAKGNTAKFRRIMMSLPNLDSEGDFKNVFVPVISGNSIRGIGRAKLFNFSLVALGIDSLADFYGNDGGDTQRVSYMFLRGGVLSKAENKFPKIGVIQSIKENIPWLGLLGGIYVAYHFESALKAGFLVPVTQETAKLYNHRFSINEDVSKLPTLNDIKTNVIAYTRRGLEGEVPKKDENAEKTQMIYSCESIAAGTRFFSLNSINSSNEGVILAGKAFFALLMENGIVGGMSSKGYGSVVFDYAGIAPENDLKNYADYLRTHSDDIKEAMTSLVRDLPKAITKEKKSK